MKCNTYNSYLDRWIWPKHKSSALCYLSTLQARASAIHGWESGRVGTSDTDCIYKSQASHLSPRVRGGDHGFPFHLFDLATVLTVCVLGMQFVWYLKTKCASILRYHSNTVVIDQRYEVSALQTHSKRGKDTIESSAATFF